VRRKIPHHHLRDSKTAPVGDRLSELLFAHLDRQRAALVAVRSEPAGIRRLSRALENLADHQRLELLGRALQLRVATGSGSQAGVRSAASNAIYIHNYLRFCGAGNLARSRLSSRLDPLESGSAA
jgi:hypothetical protein